MKNSQTNKPPVTLTIDKNLFWFLTTIVASLSAAVLYMMYMTVLPANLHAEANKYKDQNIALAQESRTLKVKNEDLLIKNTSLKESIENELIKVAELQAQANIVEKIKKDSLDEIASFNKKIKDQSKQLEFYQELMSPSIKQELQCFNMDVKYRKKYVDYGINLLLDKKGEVARKFNVEFRLLSGKNNVDLTSTLPQELAPDSIRQINMKSSIRLKGKIKHNNKLTGLKVLDVRIYNKSKEMVAQCWKVI